jgi:urease subunit gamma/beta
LLTDEVMTAARRGLSHPELVALGGALLATDDVEPGVAAMIPFVAIECSFAEGTKLVVLFEPIKPGTQPLPGEPVPGEVIPADGEIELNAGRPRVRIAVVNTGDRPVQVRSHAHFFEVNPALEFERAKAFGMRLDRPSGTGMRFDPGVTVEVELVEIGGTGNVRGFGNLTNGSIHDLSVRDAALARAAARGYKGA